MALAKNHHAAIEAELDREIQAELAAHSEQQRPDIDLAVVELNEQHGLEQSLRFERSRKIVATFWHGFLGGAITIEHRVAKMLNRLVEKGERFRYQMKRAKQKREAVARQAEVSNPQPSVKLTAVDKIHNLEHSIEHSLDRGRNSTLHWIGVPNREDFIEVNNQVKLLSEKIEFLEQELQQMNSQQASMKVNHTVIA